MTAGSYRRAQQGIAEIKAAIVELLEDTDDEGLKNSQIGRMLGIYAGHKGHVGHIPRVLLANMEAEGVVEQNPTSKRWRLRKHRSDEDEQEVE